MSAQPRERAKWCPRCQSHLPVDSFGSDRSRHDGLTHYCRTCKAAYERRWALIRNEPAPPRYFGEERWDIDKLIARIEAQNAADLANGGSAFTTRSDG